MLKRVRSLIVGVVIICIATAFFMEERDTLCKTTLTAALSVTVVRPHQGIIAKTISATGVTIPREDIRVMTELSDVRVLAVLVNVGESVKKGQKLAVLDGESLANQLQQLESDYERACDAFSRVNAIKDTGAVSKHLVIERRLEMQVAEAKFNNGKLNLNRCTILAPTDGVVFERNAVIGGLVSVSEPLFRIAWQDEIEMEGMVPESALSNLKSGQPVSVSLAGENAPIKGTVRLIAPRVDSTTRMAAVRIRLHSENPIPVGLFAVARIVESEREGMLLPQTALQQDGAGNFVWTLSAEDKAERFPVNVVLLSGDQVMVDSIPQDARVVARAGAFIAAGDSLHAAEGK